MFALGDRNVSIFKLIPSARIAQVSVFAGYSKSASQLRGKHCFRMAAASPKTCKYNIYTQKLNSNVGILVPCDSLAG